MGMLLVLHCSPGNASPPAATLLEIKSIWHEAPHNAFTDLIRWHDRFVCAFREGRGHVSSDGKIRILTSPDGGKWQSSAVVELAGYDLRDACLSIAPDERLMLLGGASPRPRDGETAPTGTVVAFSDDAATWTQPSQVVEPGRWLWRVAWHDGKAYGISYAAGTAERSTALLTSGDGLKFRPLVPKLLDDGYPTEAVLRFDEEGRLFCLQRRDGRSPANSAMLGTSRPPYRTWQWHDLGAFFGGPNLIKIPKGPWIAAGRIITDVGPKTALAWLDVENRSLTPILELPSGGDTSYPGLVWHDDRLWVSYYSSHEGKASIYLANVKIE
jgi:hypothetical protein